MVADITDYVAVDKLGALWDLVPVNEKHFSSLYVSYSLYEASDIIVHSFAPFLFIGYFYGVKLFLCLDHVGADNRVHNAWLKFEVSCGLVDYCPVLSIWLHEGFCISGCRGWNIDVQYMVYHELFSLDMKLSCVLSMYFSHSFVPLCVLV